MLEILFFIFDILDFLLKFLLKIPIFLLEGKMRPKQTFKNLPFQRKDYIESKMRYLQMERTKQKISHIPSKKKEKEEKGKS